MCREPWVEQVVHYPDHFDTCDSQFSKGKQFVWDRCGTTHLGECCVGECSLPKSTESCKQRSPPNAVVPLVIVTVVASLAIAVWTEFTRKQHPQFTHTSELSEVLSDGVRKGSAGGTSSVDVSGNKGNKKLPNAKHTNRRKRNVFSDSNK